MEQGCWLTRTVVGKGRQTWRNIKRDEFLIKKKKYLFFIISSEICIEIVLRKLCTFSYTKDLKIKLIKKNVFYKKKKLFKNLDSYKKLYENKIV